MTRWNLRQRAIRPALKQLTNRSKQQSTMIRTRKYNISSNNDATSSGDFSLKLFVLSLLVATTLWMLRNRLPTLSTLPKLRKTFKASKRISSSTFRSVIHLEDRVSPSLFEGIMMNSIDGFSKAHNRPPPLKRMMGDADYGDLELQSHRWTTSFGHQIDSQRDDDNLDKERMRSLHHMDKHGKHMDVNYYYRPEELPYPRDCIGPGWMHDSYPNCNNFHESLQLNALEGEYNIKYLASGHYRDSFLFFPRQEIMENGDADSFKDFVLKPLRLVEDHDWEFSVMNQIRTEGLIMERLSASNRTTNIYGYCSTSILVETAKEITYDIVPEDHFALKERGRLPQTKLDELEEKYGAPFSFNNYTTEQKLEIAIAMAEAIAEMHGFEGGVMVNDDVHPDQWLVTDDGRVILNDMNNAVSLEWNEQKQEYCQYYIKFGGDFRAPEEYVGSYVDESADVYAVGNLIFTLLTGLWPWYDIPRRRRDDLKKLSIAGETPYISPLYAKRSFIERRMVEIMMQTFPRNPKDRIDIFQVVHQLRETRNQHYKEKTSKQAGS